MDHAEKEIERLHGQSSCGGGGSACCDLLRRSGGGKPTKARGQQSTLPT